MRNLLLIVFVLVGGALLLRGSGTPSSTPSGAAATQGRTFDVKVEHQVRYTGFQGKEPLAVQVTVSNVSAASVPINPLYFTLEAQGGLVYQTGVVPFDQQTQLAKDYGDATTLPLVTIAAGQSARGWIWFDLPPGTTPTALIFDDRFGHRITLRY